MYIKAHERNVNEFFVSSYGHSPCASSPMVPVPFYYITYLRNSEQFESIVLPPRQRRGMFNSFVLIKTKMYIDWDWILKFKASFQESIPYFSIYNIYLKHIPARKYKYKQMLNLF